MDQNFDVIIVGLGAMGSATAYQLARRGHRVLGLDRFEPPHELGSSHGLTRIIREAYFEHPLYVPLVQRAYELWTDLEALSDRKLLVRTGGLMLGAPTGVLVCGALRSAREHNLPHQILSAAQVRERFPAFNPGEDWVGIWEPRAGVLFPELAIKTHLDLAAKSGADLRLNNPVLSWRLEDHGVTVQTERGVYRAKKLVLSAGGWISSLVPELKAILKVERQVLFWFEPRATPEFFAPDRCPIFICEHAPGRFFYGFPNQGDGVKIGVHHEGATTAPDHLDREVTLIEKENAQALLGRFLPNAAGHLRSVSVCMYTNTPDEHFLLDWHPNHKQVLIVSPCSGHGFKFSPVIGELSATLLEGGVAPFDLSLFKIGRHLPSR